MPSLSTYIDHTRQIWYVNIYWPAEDTRPADRKRVSRAVPASDDPAPALADFRSNALPALEAERLAAQPKPAENGKKPAGRTQGPLLRDLANWYLDTYLPYNRAAKKTIEYYQSTLWNFIGYCQTRHVARTGQLSARVVQEWQMHQIQHTTRSDTTCCLGCIIILLLLGVTGLLGPLLAIIGIGGAIGASQ